MEQQQAEHQMLIERQKAEHEQELQRQQMLAKIAIAQRESELKMAQPGPFGGNGGVV